MPVINLVPCATPQVRLSVWACLRPFQVGVAACGIGLLTNATRVRAHADQPLAPHDLVWAWSLEPAVLLLLICSAWLYGHGVGRLWRRAGRARGIRPWQAMAFVGGWTTLGVALVSPLDQLGTVLFSAHMVQHVLLMLLAAPLLVLSRPLVPFLWSLPMAWRRGMSMWKQRTWARRVWRMLTAPSIAWLLHAVVLWVWHVPGLYQATLTSQAIHALQHGSFLGSAMLFWWALLYGKYGRSGYGIAVLAVFTTAIHSSILGALLTFASVPWYAAYMETTAAWGLEPLEDQQLAGLVMWVPSGVLYTLASLALLAVWLQEAERRTLRCEARMLLDEQG